MKDIEYTVSLRRHPWFDGGIAGFELLANQVARNWPKIQIRHDAQGIKIIYEDENTLKQFVDACYEQLASLWWNISTPEQEKKAELVMLDRDKNILTCVAKRKPTPVADLSVAGGSSWRASGINLADMNKEMQERIRIFCKEHSRKLWGAKQKLVYEQPSCHSIIETFPKKKKKQICSVCGREMVCSGVTQTAYPLFSSQSATYSFNSQLGRSDQICWECDLLGKFAVNAAFYKQSDGSTQIMQIYSYNYNELMKAHEHFGSSSSIRNMDSSTLWFRNFGRKNSVIDWAKLPYETLWGFYLEAYETLLTNMLNNQNMEDADDAFEEKIVEETASIGILLIYTESKGKTFITKDLVDYSDSAYVFRLLRYMKKNISESIIFGKEPHRFFELLFMDLKLILNPQKPYDPVNGMYRNKLLQKVFAKHSILREIESFVFKKSLSEAYPYLGRILFFTQLYENAINARDYICEGGKSMTKDQVNIAAKLGAQIVLGAKKILMGDSANKEKLKPLKGDLFALRKARTSRDFLEQVNRLQFRYGLVVNSEIYKGILEDDNVDFEDFKAYCMIAALNSYNFEMHTSEKSESEKA